MTEERPTHTSGGDRINYPPEPEPMMMTSEEFYRRALIAVEGIYDTFHDLHKELKLLAEACDRMRVAIDHVATKS